MCSPAALCAIFLGAILATATGEPLGLSLPTDNTALLAGKPEDFYQFIDRDLNGEKSTPWEGGQYGFVRNPVMTGEGLVYGHFHEGIDIKPMHRDANGVPQDEVRAIADGTVVYASLVAGYSNYGHYVVVEHVWDGCKYYSLYAHLRTITATVGAPVKKGGQLGILGCTGAGIDQRRAHVHLELNLMLSPDFETWHSTWFPADINRHGIYNGLNLAGMDIARLYLALQKNPALTIPEFLARSETLFKVAVPATWRIHVAKFYPWLVSPQKKPGAPSLEISFDPSGMPLKITSCDKVVTGPELTDIKFSPLSYALLTRQLVTGSGKQHRLSDNGVRYLKLLTGPQ